MKLSDLRCLYHHVHVHLVEPVSYVVADGGGEDEDVLHDDTDVLPQRREGDIPGVVSVDGYATLGNVVEPWDDVGYRTLARSGPTEQGDELARVRLEVDFADRAPGSVVADRDVFEGHVSLDAWHGNGVRLLTHGRLCVEHMVQPLTGR